MRPEVGDLILTRDLYIAGEYESIGIFMGFEEQTSVGIFLYKRMNILLNSGPTFVCVTTVEEQRCIEVLARAHPGRSQT